MATYKPFLHNYKRSDGTSQIIIRITVDREHAYLPTKHYVTSKDWSGKWDSWVKKSESLFAQYNTSIERKIKGLKKAETTEDNLSAEEIKEIYLNHNRGKLYAFYESTLKLTDTKSADATNELKEFILETVKEFFGEDFLIRKLDLDKLENYQSFLLKKGMGQGSVNLYLGKLSSVMSQAAKKGLIQYKDNPFHEFKYTAHEFKKVFLTVEEIRKLDQTPLTRKRAILRDVYIAQFAASGARFGDTLQFRWSGIRGNRLEYVMDKNGKKKTIPIRPKLREIIDRYASPDREYIFPLLKPDKPVRPQIHAHNVYANKVLKDIAKEIEINPEINTHSARHSFANIAKPLIDDKSLIQESLGHSDLKTTMDYMDTMIETEADKVVNAVMNIFENVSQ